VEEAINKEAVAEFKVKKDAAAITGERIPEEEVVRPKVPLEKCLDGFLAENQVKRMIIFKD